ncbi:MAG: TonB-dependent receptor [Phycisphaerae bacterium]|nr:TonB-dependent receptor [Phycisphaerae bacterium]NIX26073.1 hypothetical protein [Phycisphaerae bacterium]
MKQIIMLIPLGIMIFFGAGLSQEVTGSLEGWVLDSQEHPLAAVNILIKGPSLQGERGTATNEQGYFRVLALPVGQYNVKVSHVAHQEVSFKDVSIHLGKTRSLGEISLQPKTLELQEVIVSAAKPLIDPTTTTVGDNLQAKTFETLPTERNFRTIMALLPHANTSYLGDETNVAGSTGSENVYFIDGINTTDPRRATGSTNLPHNFVKEIQLKEGGYEAEFGKSLGAIVNVVTYSGGNDFQWNAFGYLTNSNLASDARFGLLDANVDAFATYDFGLSVGGPVIRDKLWYFMAYNASFDNQDIEVPGFGFQEDRRTSHMFAGKLSWQATDRTDVVFTLIGDPTTHHRIGPPSFRGFPTALQTIDPLLEFAEGGGINLSVHARSHVRRNLFLEATVAHYRRETNRRGDTETGRTQPLFIDLATGTWSGGIGSMSENRNTRKSVKLSATLFWGQHTLKAGIEYEDNLVDRLSKRTEPGTIQKVSDSLFQVLVSTQDFKVRNRVPALFLQDSWLLSTRLRINFGLRWDGQYLIGSDGSVAQSITGQYQPRIGFILQPGKLGTRKIFGSFGRFYQQLPLYLSSLGHTQWENRISLYDKDPRNPGAVPFNEIVIISPGDPPVVPEVQDLEGEHFDELTAGYEQAIGGHLKFGIRGIYRTLRENWVSVWSEEKNNFIAGNQGKGDLDFLPRAKRDYKAFELTVERSGGTRLNFSSSYVLSRTSGNYTGLYDLDSRGAQPGNNTSLQFKEQIPNSSGLLPNDRTHVFKFYGSYKFTSRFRLGTFFTLQRGTPLNELGTIGFFNRIKFLVPRGSAGRTPTIWDLNLRFTYDMRGLGKTRFNSRLILDVLHVGSPREVVDIEQKHFQSIDDEGNQFNPNPNYGKAIAYQPPMTVRLGLEIGL